MIGTVRQIEWALTIRNGFENGIERLPDIDDATFWITHRHSSSEELMTAAAIWRGDKNRVSTAFTTRYPKYGRAEVAEAFQRLDHAIILDTETSGLLTNKQSEIVELAIIAFDSGTPLFHSLLKPYHYESYGEKETQKAIATHGITREELDTAPTLADVWQEVTALFSSYQLIAYNDAFDIPLIRRSAFKWGLNPPQWYSTCAMKLTTAFFHQESYLSLTDACTLVGIDREQFGESHRALADVLATRALLLALKETPMC
jgi:DNA polymerase III epsilon subunit-like protein